EFDLPNCPDLDLLTFRDRRIAMRLHKRDPRIAKELKITEGQVRRSVHRLLGVTDASNRNELALMAQVYYFEPLPEELENKTCHEALKPFTEKQRKVAARIHLQYPDIAAELSFSRATVNKHAQKARERIG